MVAGVANSFMSDTLICDDCNTGNLPTVPEEGKLEEDTCLYCGEAQAEALVDGKPSCVGCKTNRKNRSPVPSLLSEQARNYEGSQGSSKHGANDDSLNRTPPEIRARERSGTTRAALVPTLMLGMVDDGSSRSASGRDKSASKPPRSTAMDDFVVRTPISARERSATRTDSTPAGVHPDTHVPIEQFKAHRFLTNYISNRIDPSDLLYNTMKDGENSSAFHSKLDNKGGFIIIIDLILGFKIGAYTSKGLRTNQKEVYDSQSGGVVIRGSAFDILAWQDGVVVYEKEGVRFNRSTSLFLNFDDLKRASCSFLPDPDIKNWPSKIEEINVYKI